MLPATAAPGLLQQQAPSLLGTAAQGLGFGNGPYGVRGMNFALAQQQASMMAGAAPINFLANSAIPFGVSMTPVAAFTMGPILAGQTGRPFMQAAGRGLGLLDPFAWGAPGWRFGFGLGRGALGLTGGFSEAAAARGMAGTLGRYALAGGMGVAGAAPGLLAGMAAYEAVAQGGRSLWRGAQRTMTGQVVMSQIAPQAVPGMGQAAQRGAGEEVGRLFGDWANQLGTSVEDVGRLAQDMNTMRLFQTTRSVREFKARFSEVLSAVKEIAETTQSTIDDSLKTFGELRQQGFYTTADVKAAAARRAARGALTGLAEEQLSAVGQVGSQTARAFGLRGRVGAEAFETSVTGISRGLRAGTMDEEAIMEMGGPEAAGMRLAQQQLGFLGTSRGRAMIAATMGKGGAPDPTMMARMMSGQMTTEEIVERASGRGLGVLRQAGLRETRELYAPYAGMMMVQMAMAQQRQLYGYTSEQGILEMMGTMDVGRDEARLMMQQGAQLSQQMREQVQAQQLAESQAEYRRLRQEHSLFGRTRGFFRRNFGLPLQEYGSQTYTSFQRRWQALQEAVTGYREYEGGDLGLAGDYFARQPDLEMSQDITGGGSLFGLPGPGVRYRRQTPLSARTGGLFTGRRFREDEDYQALGAGQYARRSDLAVIERARDRARSLSREEEGRLSLAIQQGDLRRRIEREWGMRRFGQQAMGDRNEFTTYFLAKEVGRISQDTTFEEYMGGGFGSSLSARTEMQETFSRRLQGEEDERLRALLPVTESGLRRLGSLQSEREMFQTGARGFLMAAGQSRMGSWTDTEKVITSDAEAFLRTMQTSGQSRQAFSDVMDVLTSDADPAKKSAVLEIAREKLGPEGFRIVQDISRRIRDNPTYRETVRKEWRTSRSGFERRGAVENVAPQMERMIQASRSEAERITKSTAALTESERLFLDTRGAARASDVGTFRAGVSQMISGAVTSGGAYTSEEEAYLNEVLGDQAGSRVGTYVRALTGKEGASRKAEALRALGIEGEDLKTALKGLSSGDAATRQQTVVNVLTKAMGPSGIIDPGRLGGGEAGTEVQGVQTDYIEANTAFVQAVGAFVSALGKAGIEGIPEIEISPALSGKGSPP